MNLVVKDAFRQIIGRVGSALTGFLVIKIISPYLGVLRYGDYSTLIAYFAIRSALADFGVYVIGLRELGKIKNAQKEQEKLSTYYSKFFSTRIFMIVIVYSISLAVAYMIPAYRENPYLFRGLPLGMLFSACFMIAGILQTPLQLSRKMEQVSIALLVARAMQLWVIWLGVYVLFTDIAFDTISQQSITAFSLIIGSLVVSAVAQWVYVYIQGKKHIPLRWIRDRSFTKQLIFSQRKYGLAYYLSSFHTLIVTILLSIFFATNQWYDYAGIWWLALQLVTILLIIPSALGNSLIHKVSSKTIEQKKQSFGALLELMVWIGCVCIVCFSGFGSFAINFIWWQDYLSAWWTLGSDTLLIFLWIVLTLSFVKQVFNYLFVSTDLQNTLLSINLGWVTVGLIIGVPLVWQYDLIWWLIMQILLEVGFVWWALRIAHTHKVLPYVHSRSIAILLLCCIIGSILLYTSTRHLEPSNWIHVLYWLLLFILIFGVSFSWLRKKMRLL